MLTPSAVIGTIVFIYGTVIGSFLNVCIHRVPRGESVIRPRSKCPGCEKPIKAWQNIPVISFLLLRGRCGSCGQPISWRYPAVEVLTGLLLAGIYLKYGLTAPFFVNSLFACLLIVLIFIDLDVRILPDIFTKGGIVAGLVLSSLQDPAFLDLQLIPDSMPGLLREIGNPLLSSLAGVLFGAGFLWGVAWIYLKLRKIDGMGFGDVKLIAMIGAFTGWQLTWLTILGGSLLGAILGGGYMLVHGVLFNEKGSGASGEGSSKRSRRRKIATVDINVAEAEDLQRLQGINRELAQRIVDFTWENGPFLRKKDLMKVEGIGEVEFRRIQDLVTARYPLPFGTFLGMAAILAVFFGPGLIDWYFSRIVP